MMKKVRISINQEFLSELKRKSGIEDTIQLTNEAFTLLRWAVDQANEGRILTTLDEQGERPLLLSLPTLLSAFKQNPDRAKL